MIRLYNEDFDVTSELQTLLRSGQKHVETHVSYPQKKHQRMKLASKSKIDLNLAGKQGDSHAFRAILSRFLTPYYFLENAISELKSLSLPLQYKL